MRTRATIPRVVVLVALALALSSCRHFRSTACREPALPANLGDNPPLKVAPGLDLPDTRNAVKVPPLNEPERPRGRDAPCLVRPPAFGS